MNPPKFVEPIGSGKPVPLPPYTVGRGYNTPFLLWEPAEISPGQTPKKFGQYVLGNVVMSVEDYRAYVVAWVGDTPWSWEEFLSEAKSWLSRDWRTCDEQGIWVRTDDDCIRKLEMVGDQQSILKKFEILEARWDVIFEKNMRSLYALPFPKKVVLAIAQFYDNAGVQGVCSACCAVRAQYSKLHDGKELPLVYRS
jgi:hypothetical protein